MEFQNRREKLCRLLKSDTSMAIHLKGESLLHRAGSDVELPLRQESNFLYLTGVGDLHDCQAVIDVSTASLYLFIPRTPAEDVIWSGEQPLFQDLASRFGCSKVFDVDADLDAFLGKFSTVLTLAGSPSLVDALAACRLIKSEWEVDEMRAANKASSEAHVLVMRSCRQLVEHKHGERELAASWYGACYARGLFKQAYLPIVAYSTNAAILHYSRNNSLIHGGALAQGLLLVDAGGERESGYASDITRTYPVCGKFSARQRIIYSIVLDAQMSVMSRLKPGVEWESMHRLATVVICRGLIDAGIIDTLSTSDVSVEDLCWKLHLPQLFFPHGLGHVIGLDVHDVGGYPRGVERIQEPAIKYLRMRRQLEAGMVVTVEPGIYFIESLIAEATDVQKQYLDLALIQQYRVDVGGVRIEDCVLITATGHDNLTAAPKEILDIERTMATP